MMDDQARPWGQKGLSCEHAPYLNLAIAVVEMARQDVAAGKKVFRNWGTYATGAVIRQAALSWRWLSDPSIVCHRLSFAEICDACGIDQDRALDEVDAMAEEFPPVFRRHLESILRQIDAEPPRRTRQPRKRKEAGDVGTQQKAG